MGKPQRRFGEGFAAEAVRLVETSGRTQKEIAEDLGSGCRCFAAGWANTGRRNWKRLLPTDRRTWQSS